MSSTESEIQPFYFKSYGLIIGTSRNVNELRQEFARLAEENRAALEYHMRGGHIADWLDYANERELAKALRGVSSIEETLVILSNHQESSKQPRRQNEMQKNRKEQDQRSTKKKAAKKSQYSPS